MALGLLGWLRRRIVVLAIFVVMLAAHAVQGYVPSSLDRYGHHLQLATFFVAGSVFYLYRDRIHRSYGWLEIAGLVTLGTAVVEVGFVELLPLTGTYLLLYLAYEPWLERVHLPRGVDLSYGIYLYAWPVQQLLVQAAGPAPNPWTVNPWTVSVAALAGSGLLAWVSWTVIERPALALKRRARAELRVSEPPVS
jgi:peptidoglycan/LPS O-acetylase OafA/YrhL